MVKLWTAKPLQVNERVVLLPAPPWYEPSVCVGTSEPDDCDTLFQTRVCWDLLLSNSDQPMDQRLSEMVDWPNVEGWIARRDTPQCRWLDQLSTIEGHLGKAIVFLMEKSALTVKEA